MGPHCYSSIPISIHYGLISGAHYQVARRCGEVPRRPPERRQRLLEPMQRDGLRTRRDGASVTRSGRVIMDHRPRAVRERRVAHAVL